MASIIVSGDVLHRPTGSNLAAHLHYLIGLRKLGHRVVYLEERSLEPDPGAPASGVPRTGLLLLGELLRRCRVEVPVVWIDSDAGLLGGMVWPQLRRRLSRADLLLDLGGHCWLGERELPARRAMVDVDAGAQRLDAGRQLDHDVYFSYRRSPGDALGHEWLPTVPPVVPRLWYGPRPGPRAPFQALVPPGCSPEDPRAAHLLALPPLVGAPLSVALGGAATLLGGDLRRAGWTVQDAPPIDSSLSAYRARVVGAQGAVSFLEASAAATEGSWVSPDSACFLAAGRPLLIHESGDGSWLPVGEGVLMFDDAAGAAAAIERVCAEPDRYWLAARETAKRVLHYRVVLSRMLERALPRRLAAVA